jgi:hypothetical protein
MALFTVDKQVAKTGSQKFSTNNWPQRSQRSNFKKIEVPTGVGKIFPSPGLQEV